MRQGTMTAITAPVVVIANNIILILWGQSNDLGFGTGDPADSKYNDPNPNARILGDDYVWRVLSFPSNNKGVTVGEDDGFGAELSVAYNMMDQDDIRIVKYGKGATDIANDWAVGTALKLELINQINIAILAYPNHDIHFYHNQYEKDVANAQRSADYYDNCVLFYNDLEANINGTIKTLTMSKPNPNMQNSLNNPLNYPVIRDNMVNYASAVNANIIDADSFALKVGDLNHYTAASQIKWGNELYTNILKNDIVDFSLA